MNEYCKGPPQTGRQTFSVTGRLRGMKRVMMPALGLVVAACAQAVTDPSVTVTESVAATTVETTVATSSSTTTSTTTTTMAPTTSVAPTTTVPATTTLPPGVTERPDWLGTRTVEYGVPIPTPPELSDRRFVTVDHLPPPTDGFEAAYGQVPSEVAARSTWTEECPVGLEDLSYMTVAFRGFDGRDHMGEMIVAASAVEDLVAVFETLYEADYPIEEMRVASMEDLEAEPTGDGNLTESFVCRLATGGSTWSQHAFGLAVDINPFHNPYLRGDVLIPEMAGAYLDRDRVLPGMIVEGDVVTQAFDAIGWGWGGRWSTLDDWQHFSRSGR